MRTRTGLTLITFLLLLLGTAQAQTRLPYGAFQTAPERYSDVPVGHWAGEAVERLTRLGILTGYPDDTFRGTQPLTRYEVALVGARLIDYINTLTGLAEDDPEFVESLREAGEELGGEPLSVRTERIERGLEQAASLEYVRSLEARVVALEALLNEEMGADFPGAMTEAGDGVPLSAAEAAGVATEGAADTGFGVAPPATQTDAQRDVTGTIALSRGSAYPFYVGVAPGVNVGSGDVLLSLQTGYDGLFGPVGGTFRLTYDLSTRELRASADATVRFAAFVNELELYGGLGVGGSFGEEDEAFFLEAPLGAEYLVTPRVGLFAQVVPFYTFTPFSELDANVTAGVNFRFR